MQLRVNDNGDDVPACIHKSDNSKTRETFVHSQKSDGGIVFLLVFCASPLVCSFQSSLIVLPHSGRGFHHAHFGWTADGEIRLRRKNSVKKCSSNKKKEEKMRGIEGNF